MSFWSDDPEGMDKKIVASMISLGHAKQSDDEQEVLSKFNSQAFGKTRAWLEVAKEAEQDYVQDLVGAAEAQADRVR